MNDLKEDTWLFDIYMHQAVESRTLCSVADDRSWVALAVDMCRSVAFLGQLLLLDAVGARM